MKVVLFDGADSNAERQLASLSRVAGAIAKGHDIGPRKPFPRVFGGLEFICLASRPGLCGDRWVLNVAGTRMARRTGQVEPCEHWARENNAAMSDARAASEMQV